MKIQSRLSRLLSATVPDPLRMSPLVACAIVQNLEAGSLLLHTGLFPCYSQVRSSFYSKPLQIFVYYRDEYEIGALQEWTGLTPISLPLKQYPFLLQYVVLILVSHPEGVTSLPLALVIIFNLPAYSPLGRKSGWDIFHGFLE